MYCSAEFKRNVVSRYISGDQYEERYFNKQI